MNLRVLLFESAQSFLDEYVKGSTGCVLLDIRMPGMSGLELQKELTARSISLPIIFLTGHGDVQIAVNAMKAGAFDFIEKPFKNDLLLDSVQKAVALGLSADISRAEKVTSKNLISRLTARERQVLDLVLAGQPNKLIAEHLHLSPRTVEVHRSHMMEKMQAPNATELIKLMQQFVSA